MIRDVPKYFFFCWGGGGRFEAGEKKFTIEDFQIPN